VSRSISRAELAVLYREADRGSRRAIRQLRMSPDDCDDFRQDFLVDLISRMKWFDPARATLGAFAGIVVRNRSKELFQQVHRERQLFAGWDSEVAAIRLLACDCSSQTEQRLDLARVIQSLPASEQQLCRELVMRTPTEVVRLGAVSRASLYRRLKSIRRHLHAEGIA
jgi:DNA-directed RNA polymerase specialized sigma24 family protein